MNNNRLIKNLGRIKVMMNLEEQETTFLTEKDIEQILNSLSDDLIFDSLKEQIENTFNSVDSSPVFYLTYFTSKYDFLINKYSEYEELCDKIKEIRESFFNRLKELLETKFDFTVEFPMTMSLDEQFQNLSHLYNFFVIRNKDNITRLIIQYIEKEMKNLIKYYKPLVDKKDLSYMNMKKSINKDIATIICKLPEIIDNINISNPSDIIELFIDDEYEITSIIIRDLFLERKLVSYGDEFINNFLKHIKENEIYYLLVRTYFMNKYNEKK
jgi:ribosomal protein S15P/S13E